MPYIKARIRKKQGGIIIHAALPLKKFVLYLNTSLELVGKQHPGKKAVPAGIFYYHVNDPMVEEDGTESEEEIRREVLEQLKLNGLVNEDPEIYRAMDTDFAGTSSVIPVALKTDGSLKATSKTASSFDFQVMSDYVNHIIAKTGRQIFDGDVSVKPYLLDGRSGCDYCPYHMCADLTRECRAVITGGSISLTTQRLCVSG